MVAAGKEEKRLAEEWGDYHEGIPAITVVVDGGWSKCSHKHSYNALSGVAIIMGRATGKLLHIGVRNKYCTACAQGIPQDNHTCHKNWSKSSSQMETGIPESREGPRSSILRFIGDGDSSVHPTLVESVPGWGHAITKIEYANHACKCYRAGLEKLVKEKPAYKGRGGLIQKLRHKLTKCCLLCHQNP